MTNDKNDPLLLKKRVLEVLDKVIDPELNRSIVEYELVIEDFINVDPSTKTIEVSWIPTTPFCPLLAYITAVMYFVLWNEFPEWNVKVKLHKDVIGAEDWNELLLNPNEMKKIIDDLKSKNYLQKFLKSDEE